MLLYLAASPWLFALFGGHVCAKLRVHVDSILCPPSLTWLLFSFIAYKLLLLLLCPTNNCSDNSYATVQHVVAIVSTTLVASSPSQLSRRPIELQSWLVTLFSLWLLVFVAPTSYLLACNGKIVAATWWLGDFKLWKCLCCLALKCLENEKQQQKKQLKHVVFSRHLVAVEM